MTVLFVCTGNTCRSPMAEAICRVRHPDWVVRSAGLSVSGALPASSNAQDAVRRYGGDLSLHRSRRLEATDCERCDVIVPMTGAHAALLRGLYPEWSDKLRPLFDVEDPFGEDAEVYARCAERISALVDAL